MIIRCKPYGYYHDDYWISNHQPSSNFHSLSTIITYYYISNPITLERNTTPLFLSFTMDLLLPLPTTNPRSNHDYSINPRSNPSSLTIYYPFINLTIPNPNTITIVPPWILDPFINLTLSLLPLCNHHYHLLPLLPSPKNMTHYQPLTLDLNYYH